MDEAHGPGGPFWTALEADPSLVTRRARLLSIIGTGAIEALAKSGVVGYRGAADEYPCEAPTDEGCPRRVIPGRNLAVCGAIPPRCSDVALTSDDLALWDVDLERTLALVQAAVGLHGVVEPVDAPCVHYVGSTPHGQHEVFLALVADPKRWRAVTDRLRARTGGQPFGLLVATDGKLPRSILTELQRDGCPCLFLHESLAITSQGTFEATHDVTTWMATIGSTGAPVVGLEPFIDVFTNGKWQHGLERAAYDRWLGREGEFDIFVDEVRVGCSKKEPGMERATQNRLPTAYFAVIRKALECRARFVPDDAQEKDTFSRARKTFDIRLGNKHDWALFPTVMTDGAATYGFRHDGGRSLKYALIFRSKSSGRA